MSQLKLLTTSIDLESIFYHFQKKTGLVFLNSSLEEGAGRYAVLAFEPEIIFKSKGNKVEVSGENKTADVLNLLNEYLIKYQCSVIPNFPFAGGAIGYIAYEFGRQIEDLPRKVQDNLQIPDIYLGFYPNLIVEDKKERKTFVVYRDEDFYKYVDQSVRKWEKEDKKRKIKKKKQGAPEMSSNFTKSEYLVTLSKIKQYLKKGDVYQVCLTQTLKTIYEESGLDLYLKLNKINPAPFSSYLNCDDFEVISSSPERFMQVKDGIIETCPIKGTVKRGKTILEDQKLKQELFDSEKEKAELTMIVDLERNDLGKICKYGTVKVLKHRELKAYPTVWHTVSTVRGELKEDIKSTDIIRSVFPGGSITGAPKIRAMEIIDELEPTVRGVYTGSVVYLGFDGYLDMSIVIRTILLKNKQAYIGVGGGIVMDSENEAEYEETLLKGKALFETLFQDC